MVLAMYMGSDKALIAGRKKASDNQPVVVRFWVVGD
jgi:hypothetical protein